MTCKSKRFAMLLLLLLSFSSSLWAQGTISDGAFELDYDPTSEDGNAGVSGLSAGDALYQISWFYRTASGTQETILVDPDNENYAGDTATLTWDNLGMAGERFSATVSLTINDAGPDQVQINSSASITAIDDVSVTMFFYIDVDLASSSGNDSATLVSAPNAIQVTDGPEVFNIVATGNDAYQVLDYSELLDLLLDGQVTNLDNSGLPFGPDDFTAAYQWPVTDIPRDNTGTFGVGTAANTEANPPPSGVRPPAQVPTLGHLSLLLMTLLIGGFGLRAMRSS